MPRIAVGTGVVLILLGLIAYFATGRASATALIPAAFGLPIAILGAVALNPSARKHAMHGAVLVATLGLIGSLVMVIRSIGAGIERPVAFISMLIMLIVTGVFVVLAVQSFIAARRARSMEGPAAP